MFEVLVLVFVVVLVAVVAVAIVQLSVGCSSGMFALFLSERRRTPRKDSNGFLLRVMVVVVVIAVGRKEAVREGDKQASGEGTLFNLDGRALLEHNNNDRGRGEWRNGGKRGREGE